MNDLSALAPDELLVSLKACAAREHGECVHVIAHLAEVARRKLHLSEACTSLRTYCVEELGYSWDEAGRRVTAAYLIVDYPVVLDMLRARQLHLSGLLLLGPVLDAGNYGERLKAAAGKTCAQIKLLVATWEPKPHVPTTVFRVKVDERPGLFAAKVEERRAQEHARVAERPAEAPRLELPPPPRAPQPEPLDAGHYKLKLTIDAETYEELMRLRDLVRHSVPDGEIAKVISKAIRDQRKAVEKRKLGRSDKPKQLPLGEVREERAPDKSRAPGAPTRREVSERDGDRCAFVSATGKRCSATAWIEFDHKITFADGGETRTSNLRLYCRAHNQARNFTKMRVDAHSATADTPT
ncbi:MAG: HNH endonuclease [Myxococcota bacterium]